MTAILPTTINAARIMDTNANTIARSQWRTQPVDSRYWGLSDMLAAAQVEQRSSVERSYPGNLLRAVADSENDAVALLTPRVGAPPLDLNHAAFGQFASLAAAPAGYLRTLSPQVAADCINDGLQRRGDDPLTLLAHRPEGRAYEARALTSQHYSRLWTANLLEDLYELTQNRPEYIVPPAWPSMSDPRTRPARPDEVGPHTYVQAGDNIAPAGAYYSTDQGRDTFLFLLNRNRAIDLPQGQTGFRFLIVWNSETGAASVGIMSGIIDAACGNHLLINPRQITRQRLTHRGETIGLRTSTLLSSAITAADAAPWESSVLLEASARIMGDDRKEAVAATVAATGLSAAQVTKAMDGVSGRNYGRPLSAYAIASALTEASQLETNVVNRHDMDRAASALIN